MSQLKELRSPSKQGARLHSRNSHKTSVRTNKRWSENELNFVRQNYTELSIREISEGLGRTEKAVRSKVERMGIGLSSLNRGIGRWTDEETAFLKASYTRLYDREVASKIGKTTGSVSAKRSRLRLRKYRETDEDGKYLDSDGYFKIYQDGNRRFYHKVVAERMLGRKLEPSEKVHHINFDKQDNREENLFVCRNRSTHTRMHNQAMEFLGILVKKGIVRFNKNIGTYEI